VPAVRSPLTGGTRRTRPLPLFIAAMVGSAIGGAGFLLVSSLDRASQSPVTPAATPVALGPVKPPPLLGAPRKTHFGLLPVESRPPVQIRLRQRPRAGILFDVRTGEVLWRHRSRRRLPIASLTKMMTGLIAAENHGPQERVMITRQAVHTGGSGVGVLPRGKRVRLETLLKGLYLVSGNDAAVALAQHDAATVGGFVTRMNERAAELGLECTRFSTPNGLRDRGNYSCPEDLAALARANLANSRIRRIVRRRETVQHFPIKGGKLFLYNNNPLLRMREPGITGLKTGFTDRAGRCYVMTARRGGRELGVVLLHSPDPVRQVRALLKLGARA
jgi:serine-type D-Ala-D-Ala carboxypeptidase (penicillin-binding protein 5/6)